jgi:hypothetical protein
VKVFIPRGVRRAVLSCVVLLILFIGAGLVYVNISDQNTPKKAPAPAVVSNQAPALYSPVKSNSQAPESVAVESLISPVSAGSNTTLNITTNAASVCKISVVYNNIASNDSGLTPKTADAYGNVSWTWTVDKTVPAGTWPVVVNCAFNGRTAVVDTSLQVI